MDNDKLCITGNILTLGTFFQPEKQVVFDSLVIVDFVIVLVNSILNLPARQAKSFGEFK